jgi:hypothetical protein
MAVAIFSRFLGSPTAAGRTLPGLPERAPQGRNPRFGSTSGWAGPRTRRLAATATTQRSASCQRRYEVTNHIEPCGAISDLVDRSAHVVASYPLTGNFEDLINRGTRAGWTDTTTTLCMLLKFSAGMD